MAMEVAVAVGEEVSTDVLEAVASCRQNSPRMSAASYAAPNQMGTGGQCVCVSFCVCVCVRLFCVCVCVLQMTSNLKSRRHFFQRECIRLCPSLFRSAHVTLVCPSITLQALTLKCVCAQPSPHRWQRQGHVQVKQPGQQSQQWISGTDSHEQPDEEQQQQQQHVFSDVLSSW